MEHGVPEGISVEITLANSEWERWPNECVHIYDDAVVIGDAHGKIRAYPYVSKVRHADGVIDFVGPRDDFILRPGPPEPPVFDDDDIDYGTAGDNDGAPT